MKSEWREVRLEEVTSKLGDGLHGTPVYDDDGEYYFINGSNLNGGNIEINSKTKKVSYEEFLKHKKDLNHRTILVAINGTLGNVGLYKGEKVCLGKSACYFNVNDGVNKQFIRYVISSNIFQKYIDIYATGTTIKNMGLKSMRDFTFNLPSSDTQKTIAHILSTLDDKIELNRKMNETLESMAQAIFKSWFVDFDPVHAKAGASSEDELDKVAKDLGISREVLDLFPSEFEESELGSIPKGWEQDVLSTHISIVKGKSYKSSELEESQTALVTLKSFLRGGGYRADGIKPYTGKYKEEQVVMPGELIMAYTDVTQAADVIGKPALVLEDENIDTLVASLDVGIVRTSSERLNKMYLYQLFKTAGFQGYILGYTSGTTVLHLKKNWADSYTILLPHERLMSKFNSITEGLFETLRLNVEQNKILQKTRDTLLPKLLSGELDVSNLDLGLSDD